MLWWLRKQLLRLRLWAEDNLQNEAESLIIWYAVSFAFGAAFYFAFPWELSSWVLVIYLEAVLILLYQARRHYGRFKLLSYAAVFMLGLCVAKADAMYQAKQLEADLPELTYISGRVQEIDYNYRGRPRLLLTDADNYERPLKGDFRLSYNGDYDWIRPGVCIEAVAKFQKGYAPNPLSNYNFERANFYKGLNATGYSVGPLFQIDCPGDENWLSGKIETIRAHIKKVIDANTLPEQGSIIKALTIGDRGSIDKEQAYRYRMAGLAHFLAISGMHMGIIALLVFLLIRVIFCLVGEGRYDLRKPAAVISILFTFAYFLISGQSVSCIRAFIMTGLVLVGVLINRQAVSLRLWAFAVLVVAIITPAAVVSPGFLMSFAAVLGLVAFYERNAERLHRWLRSRSVIGKIAAYFMGVLISDLVASLMTLPYGIYFFKQVSVYTSLGNLLAAPVIAFWVMPALLLFLISLPFGGGAWTLSLLKYGISVMNAITGWVSSLPGADVGDNMGNMPDWGILLLTLGLLWLCVWQARWRFWGIAGIIMGGISFYFTPQVDFVFDDLGQTYAYRSQSGTLKSSFLHKNRFLERMWTGTNLKGRYIIPDGEELTCENGQCLYKKRVEFSAGKLSFDGKNVPFKSGGFIDLKHNRVIYAPSNPNRLWHKN